MKDISQSVLYRLFLAKGLLREGVDSADEPLPWGRMRAVILLDNAIEVALRTLLPEVGRQPKRSDFPMLLKEILEEKPGLAAHRSSISRLHELRNSVQHAGLVIEVTEARLLSGQADAFMRDVIQTVLGRAIETVSPVAIVADEAARKHLVAVEAALVAGDYARAMSEATLGFYVGWQRFVQKTLQYKPWASDVIDLIVDGIGRAATDAARDGRTSFRGSPSSEVTQFAGGFASRLKMDYQLRAGLRELLSFVEVLRYGVDPRDYSRFLEVSPPISQSLNDPEPRILKIDSWTPRSEDAVFALDFAVTTLLKLDLWGWHIGERPGPEQ